MAITSLPLETCEVYELNSRLFEKRQVQMQHESMGGIIMFLVDTTVYGICCSDMVCAR